MLETAALAFVGIVCLIALAGTIWVGLRPVENNYESTLKQRIVRLLVIYGVTTVVLLALVYGFLP